MSLLSSIAIPFLFILAAYCQLKAEAIIYSQKDNKQGYAALEPGRKFWRNCTGLMFGLIGLSIGFNLSLNAIAPVVLGLSVFYILFDGLYATKIRKQSFWYVGITGKLDKFIKTEKRSKLFKLSLLIVSLVGYIVNILL